MTATRTRAVRTGLPVKPIPLMVPYVPPSAIAAVCEVLGTRWIGQGPKVEEFEQRFSGQMVRGRECVAVGSCTDALHLAYLLAGIGPGDQVIAPLFTCTATNIPLLWMGAEIRFADVSQNSLSIDVAHVRRLITEKTKAIVCVHYGGKPAALADLSALGMPVIEDCAQALGATQGGRPVGTEGKFACFSFQAVKHLSTGDGGLLVVPQELALQAHRMRWFGIDRWAKQKGIWSNDITEVGYKYQMNDIAASMALAGLDSLDGQLDHRRALLGAYTRGLEGISGIRQIDADPEGAAWLSTVVVENRSGLKTKLAEEGIESDPVHYRNDRYSIFARFRGEFPNMEAIDGKYLCLPLHMGMVLEDVERICAVIRGGW